MTRHRRRWVSRQGLDRPGVGPVTDTLQVQLKIARQDSVSFSSPLEQSVVEGLDSQRGKDCHRQDSVPITPPREQYMTRHRRCWVSRQGVDRPVVGPVTDTLEVQLKLHDKTLSHSIHHLINPLSKDWTADEARTVTDTLTVQS